MKQYLADILPRLQKYSARLDNLSLITDTPWIQVDDSNDRIVFIFRSKGSELLVSENGDVNTCSWEYLDYMDALLVKMGERRALYNHGFLDDAVMILSKDGSADYLLLVNEKKVEARDRDRVLARLNRKYLESGRAADTSVRKGQRISKNFAQPNDNERDVESRQDAFEVGSEFREFIFALCAAIVILTLLYTLSLM